jgi:hypothetical protein
VLSRHDSRAAPQTVQTASPVCGTKNFSSVRLYSAPQLHCTIVAIPGICASDRRFSSPELCHNRTDPLYGNPRRRGFRRCHQGYAEVRLTVRSGRPMDRRNARTSIFRIFRQLSDRARLDKTSHRALTTRTFPRQLGSASRMHLTGVSLASHRQPRDASPHSRAGGGAVHSITSGLMQRSKQHLHSITSSAIARMPGGMVRPSALAALRLITSSNLVGRITGRSAGFSPLRTRPV